MCRDDAKNPLFFGWECARRRKRDIHPADAIVRAGHVGRGLVKGGESCWGRGRLITLWRGHKVSVASSRRGEKAVQVDFCG